MQELHVQEQIEPELHVCLLVQMTLLICHVTIDKLPNLQPEQFIIKTLIVYFDPEVFDCFGVYEKGVLTNIEFDREVRKIWLQNV